jgi:DNA-binding IclR family transcriptional regulator
LARGSHLATLRNDQVFCLDKVRGSFRIEIPTEIGRPLPLHCTSLGKILLAYAPASLVDRTIRAGLRPRTQNTVVTPRVLVRHLERIRETGIALELEELRPGIGCIAAPILDSHGKVIAAISLSGDPRTKQVAQLSARMRRTAAQISRDYLDDGKAA